MRAWAVVGLLLLITVSGCLSDNDEDVVPGADNDVGYPYAGTDYVMEGEWSVPLQEALYEMLPGEKVWVPVRDGVEMSLGIFRPDKEGCDWTASELPDTCQLPVVMSASPYNLQSVGEPSGRPPLPEWLVPRDFIAVQMSLRGTGESGGCMEYKAPQDVDDISDVVDWIVDQPWSNGNVGVAGRSYVGTSAWAAAASGNPHVKTIMPISGAVSSPDLLFRNGTSEVRALIPHLPIYWATYAVGASSTDPEFAAGRVTQNICPGAVEPHVEGPMTSTTGEAGTEFWQNRNLRAPILDNYEGSAWVIHGMQDWNVDPSQVVPYVNEMIDAGIPTRAWLGQWAHAYPDNTNEHWNTRWDWSTQVVDWFEYWLRDAGAAPQLGVEVEDELYRWRHEDRFPPADVQWLELQPGDALLAPNGGLLAHDQDLVIPLEIPEDMQVAGLIQLQLQLTPGGNGGQIAASIESFGTDEGVQWGVLDLRHADGGNTNPDTVTPGETLLATLQFEPTDTVFQAGEIQLRLSRTGIQDIAPDANASPILVNDLVLRLPTVERDQFIPIPLPTHDPRAPSS